MVRGQENPARPHQFYHRIYSASGDEVASLSYHQGEEDADAALIAAAPKLLAALESAIRHCSCTLRERDSGHNLDCFVPTAEGAIAKAKGDEL
jgi:hypothetical protein